MNIRVYHTLPGDAVMIRKEVFMKEQGFHDEFDETDQTASHIVLYIENIPAATCRFFPGQPDFDEDCPHIWMKKDLS